MNEPNSLMIKSEFNFFGVSYLFKNSKTFSTKNKRWQINNDSEFDLNRKFLLFIPRSDTPNIKEISNHLKFYKKEYDRKLIMEHIIYNKFKRKTSV